MGSDEQQAVIQPDEVRIEIAIGRAAKLSPEVREALDKLMQALEAKQEVEGYFNCADVAGPGCDSYFACRGVTM